MAKKFQEPLSEDTIISIVSSAVEDAQHHMESYDSDWEKAHRYYDGECDVKFKEGRSEAVYKLVEEFVEGVVTEVIRQIAAEDKVALFIPNNDKEVNQSEEATRYIHDQFERHGYELLKDCGVHSALCGFAPVKVDWNDSPVVKYRKYKNIDEFHLAFLLGEEGTELIESEELEPSIIEVPVPESAPGFPQGPIPGESAALSPAVGEGIATPGGTPGLPAPPQGTPVDGMEQQPGADMGMPPVAPQGPLGVAPSAPMAGIPVEPPPPMVVRNYNITIRTERPAGVVRWELLDQASGFFVDGSARSLKDSYIVGSKVFLRAGDLLAQGFSHEDVNELIESSKEQGKDRMQFTTSNLNYDDSERNESDEDRSMVLIELTEAFMRMDKDGTGRADLHRFLLGRSNKKLLLSEPVSNHPYAIFRLIPINGKFEGRSLAKGLIGDQDFMSSLKREYVNSIGHTNAPKLSVMENDCYMPDLRNEKIGGMVRVTRQDAVRPIWTPVIATHALDAIDRILRQTEDRIGLNSAGSGMNPSGLRNVTASAMDTAVDRGMGPLEIMARNLVSSGLVPALKLVYDLTIENHEGPVKLFSVDTGIGEVDPRSWNQDAELRPNVGIGKGSKHGQKEMLLSLVGMQKSMKDRPDMMRVTSKQIHNGVADLLSASGVFNPGRYFTALSDQEEAQMTQAKQQSQQAQQAQGGDGGQGAAYLQGEQIKAQTEAGKAQMKAQLDMAKMRMEDDRKRDEAEGRMLIDMIKLGLEHGTDQIDHQKVLDYLERPRESLQ